MTTTHASFPGTNGMLEVIPPSMAIFCVRKTSSMTELHVVVVHQ